MSQTFKNNLRKLNVKRAKPVAIAYEDESRASQTVKQSKIAKKEVDKKFLPENYVEIVENIRKMRAATEAPVDTMGCGKCFDEAASDRDRRFQILVSLMLSSQTKDEVTFAASQKLKTVGFTAESLAKIDEEELQKLLIPVGFYKNKSKFIKQTSQILLNEYNGDIPNTAEGLMKLPGVGPKMAHICMNSAWNVVTGIGVDVHVHRISNRLHWVPKPTTDPEKTRLQLESWLPKDLWSDINLLLVGFGQTICTPKSPKCSSCLNQKLCPSAFQSSPPKKSVKKKA